MRALGLAGLLCTGCQVFFPLTAPPAGDDDDGGVAIKPSITLELPTPHVLGNQVDTLQLQVHGNANDAVFYRIDAPVGGFTPTSNDVVALDGQGNGSTAIEWHAPLGPFQTTITIDAAYDSAFTDPTTLVQDVEVVQPFGQFADQTSLAPVLKDELYAHRITTTANGPCTLGMFAQGNGTVRMAIYDATGAAGNPGLELANTEVEFLGLNGRMELPIPIDLPVGTYWLAWDFSNAAMMQATTQQIGDSILAPRNFGPLPSSYPATGVVQDDKNYTVYVVITNPP